MDHLIANPRPQDSRDILLGQVQAPVAIPSQFVPDISWLQRNFQGQTSFCGEHSGTHFKALLENNDTGSSNRFTPRFGAIQLKNPSSAVYDGFAPDAGTTLTAIFKWLQQIGADSFEPLEDNVTLPIATYLDSSVVTPNMTSDASAHKIQSYGFRDTPTFAQLQQDIYQNKAVIILIRMDDGFFGTTNPTFTTTPYGHFIVAFGYDENFVHIIDSADADPFAIKTIHQKYITPQFFKESGTAIDMSIAQVRAIVQQAANIVQEVTVSSAPLTFKQLALQKVALFLNQLLKNLI